MTNELLNKAKAAKSPEELLKIAHENGQPEFTMENAEVYFDAINHHGELADEEMDVSAGSCALRAHNQKMVSALNSCKHFKCGPCNGNPEHNKLSVFLDESRLGDCDQKRYDPGQQYAHAPYCGCCYYCSYERGAWWCNNAIHYNE